MLKILTVGVYDYFHLGHLRLFKQCKEYADYLIVAVQESEVVKKFKPAAKMVYSTEERMFMVESLKYVDEVIPYRNVDDIVKSVEFDVFAKGPDQNHEGFQRAINWALTNGKSVVTIPRTEGVSSTILRNYLKDND